MDDLTDIVSRIVRFLLDNVFLLFVLFGILGMFGGDKDKKAAEAARGKRRPAAGESVSTQPMTYASDNRPQPANDGMFDSGMEYGSDSLFRDDAGTEWGQTKFGFDESEWGSSFGEKRDSEPVIYTGKN